MNSTEISSEAWMALAQKAWVSAQGVPSASELMAALQMQLVDMPASGMSEALAKGIAELTTYAASELDDDETSLDAETEALEVARSVVRPVLTAKLQRRLDSLDMKMSGHSICPSCDAGIESRGQRARIWSSTLGELALVRPGKAGL